MSDIYKKRLEQLEDENVLVGESLPEFASGVWTLLHNLKLPAVSTVSKSFIKINIVVVISAIIFSIIDSFVAPIARFLLNG